MNNDPHIARAFEAPVTADGLIVLLKHPLAGSGGDRGTHLLLTRDLELRLRRHGPVFPTGADLQACVTRRGDPVDRLLHLRPVLLAGRLQVVRLGALAGGACDRDGFIDGLIYDGRHPNAYLQQFAIGLKGVERVQ